MQYYLPPARCFHPSLLPVHSVSRVPETRSSVLGSPYAHHHLFPKVVETAHWRYQSHAHWPALGWFPDPFQAVALRLPQPDLPTPSDPSDLPRLLPGLTAETYPERASPAVTLPRFLRVPLPPGSPTEPGWLPDSPV